MAAGFSRAERGLVATAAAIVFTRVFAFSLTMLGFTEYARTLSGIPAGWGDVLAGVALGAYGITMALAQLGTGILSDRIGRKPVLLGGTLVFALGAVLCALADSIWLLLIGRLLAGLGGVSSAALAAVGESVPAERRTMAMALIGIPAGFGVFLGFLLGPMLATVIGFTGLFWLTAALGLAAVAGLVGRSLPDALPGLAQPARSLTLPVLALAAAGFTINYAMTAVMFDFQSGVLAPLGNQALLALGGMLLVSFVVMAVVSKAVDRNSSAWLPMLVALALLAAAAPVFRLASPFAAVAVAGVAFFASHAVLSAILPAQVSRLAGRSGGRGHGIQLVVAYLGSAAGAATAGLATAANVFVDTFVVLALVAGATCWLVWTGLRREDTSEASPLSEAQAP